MNYCAKARTNYFHVINEDAYQDIFKHLRSDEGELIDFTEKDEDGNLLHGFGAVGSIAYYSDDYLNGENEDDEPDFNMMFDRIRAILPDGECIVYIESGHEGLRYVNGFAVVGTNRERRSMDLLWLARSTANELGVKEYKSPTY